MNTARLDLGPLSTAETDEVKRRTGMDLAGYRRVADSGDLRHAMISHGDPAREAARGQVAITRGDLRKIPLIASSSPSIAGRTTAGRRPPGLTYTARIGRHEYTLVQQVRHATRTVAFKTLWKR